MLPPGSVVSVGPRAADAPGGTKIKARQMLPGFNGADGRIRTGDLILTKDALYLLSYISAVRAFVERK